eukprot:CAMPEP_0170536796 /NCGR_PEP_ID=MMETSP0209-20121228/102346_1 /TAXON_ID=665100 ORGANISM="Litonotus pictus, Strain P1" /NCGR_SAMPLE_ID=MMETSP0209 /ASSEMBLY_ACC=CAM_ASM_000301 /LENGTH=344 /DNA_ID=CAMNT_0010838199 /DNA_START=405 /DNA_END=1435 /DNA_ORIENTATION=-
MKGLLLYERLQSLRIRELSFFIGNYKKFIGNYKLIAKDHLEKHMVFNEPYPSTILDEKLYVGDQSHVSNYERLKHMGITHIINVTLHVPNYYDQDIKYLNIPVEDTDKYCLKSHFKLAFDFIEETFFENQVEEEEEVTIKEKDNSSVEDTDKYCLKSHFKLAFDFIEETFFENQVEEEEEVTIKEKDNSSFLKSKLKIENKNTSNNTSVPFLENDSEDNISNSSLGYFGMENHNHERQELSYEEEIEMIKEKIESQPESLYLQNELLQLKFRQMTKGLTNKNKILIHCSLGVSRSPSIAVMYLMKKFNFGFQTSVDLVKFQRNKSAPQQSFLIELEDFEKKSFR